MNTLLTLLAARIPTDDTTGITAIDADSVVIGALNAFYFIAGVTAVIVIIIAGIQYATSTGDSSRIGKAKNAILYAIVGLVIILSAFVITGFISGRF